MLREQLMKAHPERDGAFRWRGDGVSRVEGLSDAVFGFAVTLLVVSLDAPRSFADVVTLIAGLPAFAATFALLVLVWFAHYKFFRRYGLEDVRTTVLNALLLFVVLFYIYPLKFVFHASIGGLLALLGVPGAVYVDTLRPSEWPALMCVYGAGWTALYLLFALMHRHALIRADDLGLDAVERLVTRFTIVEQLIMAGVGVVSVVVTLALTYGARVDPRLAAGCGGWTYFVIGPTLAVQGRRLDRRRRALVNAAVA